MPPWVACMRVACGQGHEALRWWVVVQTAAIIKEPARNFTELRVALRRAIYDCNNPRCFYLMNPAKVAVQVCTHTHTHRERERERERESSQIQWSKVVSFILRFDFEISRSYFDGGKKNRASNKVAADKVNRDTNSNNSKFQYPVSRGNGRASTTIADVSLDDLGRR